MGKILIPGGGGGADLDVITANADDVLAPKVIVDQNGEPVAGTLALSGNAQAGHVLAGEGFYTTDPKSKQIGTMTVGSLLSFSVAAYSGKRLLAKWQNPNQAAGKPYSGVMIRYSTSGYPGTGGIQIYKGAGNNTAAGGWSQAFLDMPALNMTYYFTCVPYVACSVGDLLGVPIDFACATGADLWLTFTAGQNYTVPEGYTMMDAFAVGGGGGGNGGSTSANSWQGDGGAGGGGGYTNTVNAISVAQGQVISIAIGSGGSGGLRGPNHSNSKGYGGRDGGTSSVTRANVVLCEAPGGKGGNGEYYGGNGGSGGAAGPLGGNPDHYPGNAGGIDGANGQGTNSWIGKGQGSSTRAWRWPSGTLYAGGGGSGATGCGGAGGAGGAGGGGRGGDGGWRESNSSQTPHYPERGWDGAANTGGGGGGGGGGWRGYVNQGADAGNGGSGIVLLHLY